MARTSSPIGSSRHSMAAIASGRLLEARLPIAVPEETRPWKAAIPSKPPYFAVLGPMPLHRPTRPSFA